MAYTTPDKVEDYIEGGTGLDAAAIERYIARAEPYVDIACGPSVVWDSGRRFNPALMPEPYLSGLDRATCAQVEYMLLQGDEFFVQNQYASVSSPDESTTGRISYIGPKVRVELGLVGLINRTARVRSGS